MNPVLREGNSDRRAPKAVKAYAKKHPHRMGPWEADSKSHVAHMDEGDFYGSEQSVVMPAAAACESSSPAPPAAFPLRAPVKVQAGEVLDASALDAAKLAAFVDAQIADAKARRAVLAAPQGDDDEGQRSDHVRHRGLALLRAGAGEARRGAEADRFRPEQRHRRPVRAPGRTAQAARMVEADIAALYAQRPGVAMVNSDKGITNLHVPSDVIVTRRCRR